MSPSRGVRLAVPLACAIALATALTARRALPVGFVGQDTWPILLTSRVASADDLRRVLSRELMDGRYAGNFYRPAFSLTIAVDHALWRLDPRGYHLASALLYGAGGLVVFLVARRLLGAGAVLGPSLAAAIYLLHPAHVEVVAVPARRPDLLCWLFGGLALALPTARSGGLRSLAAVLAFLAMMSKEAGLLVPGFAFVAAWFASEAASASVRIRDAVRGTWPQGVALVAALAVRFAVLGGVGGHGSSVREATLDRVPNAVLALWALLVEPQPVIAAGVAGSPFVVGWSALLVVAIVVLARRPETLDLLRGAWAPLLWLLTLAATYALSGGLQPWYLVLPLACFALALGALAQAALRLPRTASIAVTTLLILVVAKEVRYSPLIVRYDAWEVATREGNAFLEDLGRCVEAARPGERVEAPPIPSWVPARPGEPGVRGASVLAPYSVQAWLELRYPDLRTRVVRDRSDSPAPGEILVVIDRVREGFELAGR